VKILTLNTWQERGPWQDRWEIILKGISSFQPDIVAFQELFNRFWALEVKKRIEFPAFIFPEEHAGLAVYSRYPVLSWGAVTLAPSPLEDYARYVLWVEIKKNDKRFFFFNTHLSWQLEDEASRRKQLEEILRLIHEKAPYSELILVGDLNAPPDSSEIQWFIREGGFRDLFSEVHPGELGHTWDNRNYYVATCNHKMPNRRIDQVLVRQSGSIFGKLSSCRIVYAEPNENQVWASDHFGVLAEFV